MGLLPCVWGGGGCLKIRFDGWKSSCSAAVCTAFWDGAGTPSHTPMTLFLCACLQCRSLLETPVTMGAIAAEHVCACVRNPCPHIYLSCGLLARLLSLSLRLPLQAQPPSHTLLRHPLAAHLHLPFLVPSTPCASTPAGKNVHACKCGLASSLDSHILPCPPRTTLLPNHRAVVVCSLLTHTHTHTNLRTAP